MTIRPVVPLPDSQLVVDTQGVIIDITGTYAVRVEVDSVVVWLDGLGFQNGWSGSYIVLSGTQARLVCDPPSPFTVGTSHTVYVLTDAEDLTYVFRVGLEKLTTEADLAAPQVIKADTYVWSARVHNNETGTLPPQFDGPGNVYLHVLDPRGSEVITVPGQEVGLVYDDTRNKVIIYFIRNEAIFYMEADPGDTPTTQSQLRSLQESIRLGNVTGEGVSSHADTSYPPIKFLMTQDVGIAAFTGESTFFESSSPYDAAPTPNIISGALDGPPVVLRIQRPTQTLESELLAGYFIVKFIMEVPSVIGYVAMDPEDAYVEFHDSCLTLGARYAVMPLYHLWTQRDVLGNASVRYPETRQESWGAKATLDTYGVSQLIEVKALTGEGNFAHSDATYPPWKVAIVEDVPVTEVTGEGSYAWADSSFDPIGT